MQKIISYDVFVKKTINDDNNVFNLTTKSQVTNIDFFLNYLKKNKLIFLSLKANILRNR